jgi:hypothetical protein
MLLSFGFASSIQENRSALCMWVIEGKVYTFVHCKYKYLRPVCGLDGAVKFLTVSLGRISFTKKEYFKVLPWLALFPSSTRVLARAS